MNPVERLRSTAIDRGGRLVELELEVRAPSPFSIRAWQDGKELGEFTGSDLFDCMIGLREFLESTGLLLCCQGARSDVFPTGMDRQKGDGRQAHVLSEENKHEGQWVDIFAPADPSAVSTVIEQRDFVLDFYGFNRKNE
jgi:hypothetical protein